MQGRGSRPNRKRIRRCTRGMFGRPEDSDRLGGSREAGSEVLSPRNQWKFSTAPLSTAPGKAHPVADRAVRWYEAGVGPWHRRVALAVWLHFGSL